MAELSPKIVEDFWLFGYGYVGSTALHLPDCKHIANSLSISSLIWKAPPHFAKKLIIVDIFPKINESPATLKVMFVDSGRLDHRGTPEHPGRVVTLIDRSHYDSIVPPSTPSPSYRVWGAAYHIPQEHVKEVQDYLDIREINGYSIQYTTVQPASSGDKPIEKCMVYIGLPSNPQFLGPQTMDRLAARIFRCKGPSGENRDYLFMLEEALKELSDEAHDEHVEDLAKRTFKAGLDRGEDGATVGDELPIEAAIEKFRSATTSHPGIEELEKP
ncbi:MAG: hypothetical protein Q9168_005179 [Polycauliona sp. 1 TL-2023]